MMTVPLPPVWIAAPPEVHSTLLNFGGTPAGVEAAGVSWKDLAAQYVAAAAELEGILAQIQASYQGPSAEQFVGAHQPYVAWLGVAAMKSAIAAGAHDEIAAAYVGAVAAMPTLAELSENHVVHGVLVGTNFLGVNTIPIGLNEADYVRMWGLAADVMSGWDATATAAANSIPLTTPSPILLVPGVGEAGSIAGTWGGFQAQAEGSAAGAALDGADTLGDKLAIDKVAGSGASAADGGSAAADAAGGLADDAEEAFAPDSMAAGALQQAATLGPSVAQSAASALEGVGPEQLLSSAPQMLGSAPQTLGQMLTSFGSSGAGSSPATPMSVGFPGTGAVAGMNAAGLTNLAGGAFGSGPSRPMLPSTWGALATTGAEAETAAATQGLASVTSMPGQGVSAGGGSGGGAMMAGGANNRRSDRTRPVTTYPDDAVGDDTDAEARGHSL